jgi:hypothetical protein
MTYAVVSDVAASWEQYSALGEALANPVPSGLLLHVAGPTDEGFRVIDVWASRADWERFRDRTSALGSASVLTPPTRREFDAVAVIHGPRD